MEISSFLLLLVCYLSKIESSLFFANTLLDMKETLDIKQVNAPTLVPIGATISQV